MGQRVLSRVTTCGQWCGKVCMAPKCVYTSATWGVPIHIYLSVPGVRKQYIGFHNWTSPCFMYVHGSPLLIFLTWHLQRFLLGKYSV